MPLRYRPRVPACTPRISWGGTRFGTRLVDSRTVHVAARPAAAFAVIRRIGGAAGWYYANRLWRLRGFIDLWLGGVGMRRGRRQPEELAVGDAVDFWRVEAYEPGQRLRLAAELRLPGRAWLEFDVKPDGDGTLIRQTAVFDPVGLLGLLYWYGIYPLHARVFAGMLCSIALRAAQLRDVESSHPLVPVSRSSASATTRATPQGSSSPLDATSPADDARRTDSGPDPPAVAMSSRHP